MTGSAYRKFLRSPAWRRRRAELVGAGPRRCDGCGEWRAARGIQVHHLPSGYRRLGREQPGDYVLLCGRCHKKATDKLLDPLQCPVPIEELAEALGGNS